MPEHTLIPSSDPARTYQNSLTQLFLRGGWEVEHQSPIGDKNAAPTFSKGGYRYRAKLKVASEGRRDRLVPLLAQAILEARTREKSSPSPAASLAVIAAPNISPGVLAHLLCFHSENAPEVAVGILDRKGFRHFVGQGLDDMSVPQTKRVRGEQNELPVSTPLFSDLNQWMLKVLLAPLIPENLLRAPRQSYRNSVELADAAGVTAISAYRLVRQLRHEGFMAPRGTAPLKLIERVKLMSHWKAAYLHHVPELRLRWISPQKGERPLSEALRSYLAELGGDPKTAPQLCLGLVAAADQMQQRVSRNILPHIYLKQLDHNLLASVGLTIPEGVDRGVDVYLRIPAFRESVFRAAVVRDGIPVSDIIQVWLDVGTNPAPGVDLIAGHLRDTLAPPKKGSYRAGPPREYVFS